DHEQRAHGRQPNPLYRGARDVNRAASPAALGGVAAHSGSGGHRGGGPGPRLPGDRGRARRSDQGDGGRGVRGAAGRRAGRGGRRAASAQTAGARPRDRAPAVSGDAGGHVRHQRAAVAGAAGGAARDGGGDAPGGPEHARRPDALRTRSSFPAEWHPVAGGRRRRRESHGRAPYPVWGATPGRSRDYLLVRRAVRLMVMVWSSAVTEAALAREASTFHGNEEVVGGVAAERVGTATSTPRSSPSIANRHSSSAAGRATRSRRPQASSTAIRRSSISSRVKRSRAASPAAAVRSTLR